MPSRFRDLWRAAALLVRNGAPAPRTALPPTRHVTPAGTGYDRYDPHRAPACTLLVVYGMTMAGEKEARVRRFAGSLVRSGFRVAVPDLPGMKAYRFDAADLERLTDLVLHIDGSRAGPLRIIAFSSGASLCLTAAASPALAGRLDSLLLFSPAHSLPALWDRLQVEARAEPPPAGDWENFVWLRAVLAHRQQEELGLPAGVREELRLLLRDYSDTIPPEQKLDFYRRVLRPLNAAPPQMSSDEAAAMRLCSPAGRLAALPCRVNILHDPADILIPPGDSQRILAELQAGGGEVRHRLLVTPLISHVTPRYSLRLGELFTILSMFGDLFR